MDSQESKPSRLRFLLVATYVWLVVAYVAVITIFGVFSKMTPPEFKEFAKDNRDEMLLWGACITIGGVVASFLVRELRNLIRHFRRYSF